ncbi:MAG: MinD/ParA family protein [Deltaproteobacteria bacterium]|nr:MinD/ParA family protein [Deltaproteobacteria bacterium]
MKNIRTIAITSGKGGVGKTNLAANLAVALQQLGEKVLIFDADLGLSNVDVLLGLVTPFNIQHVLNGKKNLREVIVEGPQGIKILPASSGIQEITQLDEFQRLKLLEEFETFQGEIDTLIIDTGAGISHNVAFFCISAQTIIVVISPEPTALTDGYALIKVLFTQYQEKDFKILVNSVQDASEGLKVFKRLAVATEKYLQVSLDYLGFISKDDSIPKAVRAQKSFLDIYPESVASKNILSLAAKLKEDAISPLKGSLQLFLGNMIGEANDVRL